MSAHRHTRWLLAIVAVASTSLLSGHAFSEDKNVPTTLRQGLAVAQESQKPIVAIVVGESCVYCRALEKELQSEVTRKELKRWTLVLIDAERSPEDAETLAARAIPALRLLSPTGKVIAAREGAIPATDLVEWLQANFAEAAGTLAPELTAAAELSALQAVRLARHLGLRDATAREAAIRRLIGKPEIAAPPVVAAFVEGSLSTRLAAIELLSAWHAPIADLDPWQPETLSQTRLQALTAWADNPVSDASTNSVQLLSETLTASAKEMIERMVMCEPAEAIAIRERLVRHGKLILPLVYDRLATAESDGVRQRLTALRYRLVATEELALGWPGGLERLSATDAPARHQAMGELAKKATAADEALLLELFSDQEPLIRELALQALHRLGGNKTNTALVKLLDDPDPNVQAAVLKQLAESPAPGAVVKLRAYIEKQSDPDLLVHAVRVVRAAKGKSAVECLVQLLKHENWRVRAEATEAIGELAQAYNSLAEEDQADAFVALVDVLQDDDPFVVSRAVQVLGKASLAIAVTPLAEVASRHPALAVEVVKALAHSNAAQVRVAEHLRRFAKSADATVRAAAVQGLCEVNSEYLDSELATSLSDSATPVRIAAAQGLFTIMESTFNQSRVRNRERISDREDPSADSDRSVPPQDETAQDKAVAVKLPKWMATLQQPLEAMLAAETAPERLAAALPLVALNQNPTAIAMLEASVTKDRAQVRSAARALRWLPWRQRQKLFTTLLKSAHDDEEINAIASEFAQRPGSAAAAQLWALLDRANANGQLINGLLYSLAQLYVGENIYNLEQVPKSQITAAVADIRSHARSDAHWQRVAALALLVTIDADAAQEEATQIANDPQAEARLVAAANQVVLFVAEADVAQKQAITALRSANEGRKKIALSFLALGRESLAKLDGGIELRDTHRVRFGHSAAMKPIPDAPSGITLDLIEPLARTGDPRQRACAGFLMCLMGEPEGLPVVIDYWKTQARNDDHWTKLTYQAIAALDDSAYVPVLTEIYQNLAGKDRFGDHELAAFYWTIRLMTGNEILPLRKRMREEIGLENLQRNNPFGDMFRGSTF